MHRLYYDRYQSNFGIRRLVNDVVDDRTDFEQLITFLEDATSTEYQTFAADLKRIFSSVLRLRLDQVRRHLGDRHSELYAALIDMHDVAGVEEELKGFLTLNYDVYLEHAVTHRLGYRADFGVAVESGDVHAPGRYINVLKLHGSFGWAEDWPIRATDDHTAGLWIPPGIRKGKSEYPFNAIWGLARELLDCDILRIIGCNLGANDWDLVSLLFTTMHTHASAGPYDIEIIAWPDSAERMGELFPYLGVRSLLELPGVGAQVVAEVLGGAPRDYSGLTADEQRQASQNAEAKIANPFEYWLRLKGELMNRDLPSLETPERIFERFVESTA